MISKQKIMMLTTVIMVFICSVASAYYVAYWNGDKNYPEAHSEGHKTCYVDLSSAYVTVDNDNGTKTLIYNVITTYDNSNEIKTELYTILLKGTEDGYDRYALDKNGEWQELELDYAGWRRVALKSSGVVSNHFHIKG